MQIWKLLLTTNCLKILVKTISSTVLLSISVQENKHKT